MGKWASGPSTTTADTAAREDRRGHGQLSPDPLPPGDPKQSSQPLECFAGASETLPPEDPVRRWITTRSRYCGSNSIASRRAGSCTNGQRRGHGQLSPDPLQSDPKRSSQPLEYFGSPSPKDVRVEPPGRADSSAPIKKLCKPKLVLSSRRRPFGVAPSPRSLCKRFGARLDALCKPGLPEITTRSRYCGSSSIASRRAGQGDK